MSIFDVLYVGINFFKVKMPDGEYSVYLRCAELSLKGKRGMNDINCGVY